MFQHQPNKPVNVRNFVILSLIPFLGYYSFLRLKKVRRIFLINIPVGIAGLLVLLFVNHLVGQLMNWTLLPGIDALFVYKWARQHNETLALV